MPNIIVSVDYVVIETKLVISKCVKLEQKPNKTRYVGVETVIQ